MKDMEEQEVVLTRKEKIYKKIRDRVANPEDIKYRGPLSYRYLRVIGWIAFALAQLVALNGFFKNPNLFDWNFLGNGGEIALSIISSIATPLFIVASFGFALGNHNTVKRLVFLYGAIFGGMVIGLNIFYYRYLVGFLGNKDNADAILSHMTFLTRANVFTDLFMFALFHFFVHYKPKKYFDGKKIYIFRALAALPICYVIAAYVIKTLCNFGRIDIPFAIIPFLCTKSPIVFALFALVSVGLKAQKYVYVNKAGVPYKDYEKYLKTNRNSLNFSKNLSILIAIFAFIELIIVFIFCGVYRHEGVEMILIRLGSCSIGEAFSLIIVIPFVMLYSYTRLHKPGPVDILLPIAGIGITVVVYIETIYQFVLATRAALS